MTIYVNFERLMHQLKNIFLVCQDFENEILFQDIKLNEMIYLKLCLLFFFASTTLGYEPDHTQHAKVKLRERILGNNYVKHLKPSKKVEGVLMLILKQIVSINEREQIMTSGSNIMASWFDQRLGWDPEMYMNITEFLIPGLIKVYL